MSAPEAAAMPALDSPDSNNITDLVGDPIAAGLWVAMNGNQFMLAGELMDLWHSVSDRRSVFLETLPPGLLADQVLFGAIRVGTMTLSRRPDVIAAGPDVLDALQRRGAIGQPTDYATNDLAVLARADTAGQLGGNVLDSLGDPELRVAMPDPRTEGVGRLIIAALRSRGGDDLVHRVMERKLAAGTTRLTRIHHRESARWLGSGEVDLAPLWRTEAIHHAGRERNLVGLPIDAVDNQIGRYSIAQVAAAPGPPEEAGRFVQFMRSEAVQQLYARHAFGPPVAV